MEVKPEVGGKLIHIKSIEISGKDLYYYDYDIDPRMRIMPWLGIEAPEGWTPSIDKNSRIGSRLPYDWEEVYRSTFKQEFQPVRFMSNAVSLLRCAGNPHIYESSLILSLADELIGYSMEYILDYKDAKYVYHRFDFVQKDLFIPSGWVGACAQAFVLLAYTRLAKIFPDKGLPIVKGLADAFRAAYVAHAEPPPYWISYIDEESNLWFEEYPMPQGRPNLVLNGHIFAIHALHEANKIIPDNGYDILSKLGITTVRKNVRKFRRKGNSNIYSLLGPRKGDYLPRRTIRQQCELYALTGDTFFRNMGSTFMKDMGHLINDSNEKKESMRHCFNRFLWNESLILSDDMGSTDDPNS